jgi:glycosyltransferase involved in cell wall biosynthesis
LSETVKFTGYVHNTESIYSQLNLMAFPAHNEAFGLVVLEAYQFGVPVLVFKDSGGPAELIEQIEPELIAQSP